MFTYHAVIKQYDTDYKLYRTIHHFGNNKRKLRFLASRIEKFYRSIPAQNHIYQYGMIQVLVESTDEIIHYHLQSPNFYHKFYSYIK